MKFTVESKDSTFAVLADGKQINTPGRKPLVVPTKALADAICAEWQTHGKYISSKMVLTSLAYTAIDQVDHQKSVMVESLLVYLDTDTLSYRATSSEKLATQQLEVWTPVLDWAANLLGTKWEVTSGIMPVEQSPALHKAVEKHLLKLDTMHLAGACLLSSLLSSLALMLAVLEKHIDAETAFHLSRLEEEAQAEIWGRDSEAEARAQRLKAEILASVQFLDLLDTK